MSKKLNSIQTYSVDLKNTNSRFRIEYSMFKIQNSRFKTEISRFKIQGLGFKIKVEDCVLQ